jgi:hypothetical protein
VRSSSILADLAPTSYSGTLRVVSAVESRPKNIMSSHPTTAVSSGTFKLNPAQALKASTAMVSLCTLSRELS